MGQQRLYLHKPTPEKFPIESSKSGTQRECVLTVGGRDEDVGVGNAQDKVIVPACACTGEHAACISITNAKVFIACMTSERRPNCVVSVCMDA